MDQVRKNKSFIKPVLIVLSLGFLIVSLFFFALSINKPYMGAELHSVNGEWMVTVVDVEGVAAQAGIQYGDIPVEINGIPAATFLSRYSEQGVVTSMLIEELEVSDPGGNLKLVSLSDSTPTRESTATLLAYFITSLMFWAIGFYVFLKKPENEAAILLYVTGMFFGLALSANFAVARGIDFAAILAVFATTFSPWVLLHLFIVLPEKRERLIKGKRLYFIYIPAILTFVLFLLIGYGDGQPLPGFRMFRFLEIGIGILAVIGVAVSNYFRAVSPRTRQQMKAVSFSCVVALFLFLVFYLVPILLSPETTSLSPFFILLIGIVPLGIAYAIVTRKLMDIDIIIRRGIIHGLILTMMVAILSAGILIMLRYQGSLSTASQVFFIIGLAVLASLLFGPVQRGLEYLVDRFFYKDRYDFRKTINSFSVAINSLKEFQDIARLTVGTVVNNLNLSGGGVFVKNQSGEYEVSTAQGKMTDRAVQSQAITALSQRNASDEFPYSVPHVYPDLAFIIPMFVGMTEVGVLCLLPKASKQDFSSDDLFLLQGITSVAAGAFHSAKLVHDVSLRDNFVSIASHELRTPMTSILGYAELLSVREVDKPTMGKWVNSILQNGKKMSTLINDFLDVSRIQSNNINLNIEDIDINDVINDVLPSIKDSTDTHKFTVKTGPSLPKVKVDLEKSGQILTNLLNNAVKYSPDGGEITIATDFNEKTGEVVLSVRDQGIGFSPEHRAQLFSMFYRVQRPETQVIRGSGLGLYIAKEWTEAMGGRIWLESELNKGSTFYVGLPTNYPTGANND